METATTTAKLTFSNESNRSSLYQIQKHLNSNSLRRWNDLISHFHPARLVPSFNDADQWRNPIDWSGCSKKDFIYKSSTKPDLQFLFLSICEKGFNGRFRRGPVSLDTPLNFIFSCPEGERWKKRHLKKKTNFLLLGFSPSHPLLLNIHTKISPFLLFTLSGERTFSFLDLLLDWHHLHHWILLASVSV